MIGKTVRFWGWDETGEPVTLTGVVESEFREPPEEDRYQRLNFHVRLATGAVRTPHAHECSPELPGVEAS